MSEPTEDPGLADATRWDATPLPGRPARNAPVTGETTRLDAPLPRPPAEETPAPPAQPPPTTRWDRPADAPAAPPVDPDRTYWEEGGPETPAGAPPRYELLGELGRGGMGVVHRAREVATGREVALKLLTIDAGSARERLLREGQVTAALEHEHIVRVLGAGMLDGAPYLAYELVEGCRTLDQVLVDLPPAERARYVRDAARALGHAHARGVVHRDVKPHNLLVDAAGRLKVADFGVAAGVGLERLTLSGVHVGTPSYMAPEQVDARRDDVGPWTDVWALGVVLYVALTDRLPFVAPSFHALCMTIMDTRPAAPRALAPDAPEALEAVCLRALAPRPADRYPDGEAMARDLDRALSAGADAEALTARRARRRARRALVALVCLAALGLGGALVARLREQRAAAAAVEEARQALRAARRARGTGLEELLAAAQAHRDAEAALGRLAPPRAAALLLAEPGVVERRPDVLGLAVPALLGAGRHAEAALHARELARVAPSPQARGWLLKALAAVPAHRAEARTLALEAAATGDGQALRDAADTLLALERPADAARALAGQALRPELLLVRARARLAAGDLDGAAADAAAAEGADPAERAAVAGRALAAAGRAEEALAALAAAAREGGGRWEWRAARGVALAAAGRPGEARAELDDARAIAERTGQPAAAAAVRHDRARLHLARGRRTEAAAALEGLDAPGARLDLAVARWCGGEPDAAVRSTLDALATADDALEASPAVAAAARRWRAWLALAGGDARAALDALGERPDDAEGEERAWLLAAARALAAGVAPPAPANGSDADSDADADAPPALPVPSAAATRPAALVAALHHQARLLLPAAARDPAARARCARLLARVVALEPGRAAAAADLAWAAGDLARADQAVARWPERGDVRRARLRLRLETDAAADLAEDLPLGLWAPGLEASDLLEPVVEALRRRGDLVAAWAVLEPWLERPGAPPVLLAHAVDVARARGEGDLLSRAAARRAAVATALRKRPSLQHGAWQRGDVGAIDGEPFFDIPRDADYHRFRLEVATHVSRPVDSLLSFGRYLLASEPPAPATFLARAHSFGWNPQERSAVVRAGLAEARAADPASPVPLAALATHFASARYRLGPGEAEWGERHEVSDRAADRALAAAARAPTRPGPLLLAAFALMDAGDLAEAEEHLERAEAAHGERDEVAAFLRARLAALRGDAAGAAAHLARLRRDPQTHQSLYRFKTDPAFDSVRGAREFALPPGWLLD